MTRRRTAGLVIVTALVAWSQVAGGWTLDLADSVSVGPGNVRVADLARAPVPAEAGDVVVLPGTRPGQSVTVARQTVLRRLVMAGLAHGVALAGAGSCVIEVAGEAVSDHELADRVREVLADHLPPAPAGAPATWLEITLPEIDLVTHTGWRLSWPDARPLEPGRNLLTMTLASDQRRRRLSVAAVVHAFARTPQAVAPLTRGQTVPPGSVGWVWTDLAGHRGEAIVDAAQLRGMVLVRDLAPGTAVTADDLEPQPMVQRGETIDLVVRRGRTRAVVQAECRQDGRLGQMVSVLNPMTRRLVVARVTAPGVVTLGR
ncbi:flagellar basal body P-ring formation protein FlgA [bacterium]|nr:flagellar basal body P-ring formation protein FlgA [bacterium]